MARDIPSTTLKAFASGDAKLTPEILIKLAERIWQGHLKYDPGHRHDAERQHEHADHGQYMHSAAGARDATTFCQRTDTDGARPKPFATEARQQWLPADVSGQAIRSYPRARYRYAATGVGRYAPNSGLVMLTSSFVDPDP